MFTIAVSDRAVKTPRNGEGAVIPLVRHGGVKMQNRTKAEKDILPIGGIEEEIFTIRGKRVMVDADPARPYGVTTSR